MSDKQRTFGLLPISRAELEQFFAETGVASICKECGSRDYTSIFEYQSKIPVIPFTEDPGAMILDFGMPLFITICDHCGWVRSFNRFVINSWKETKINPEGRASE